MTPSKTENSSVPRYMLLLFNCGEDIRSLLQTGLSGDDFEITLLDDDGKLLDLVCDERPDILIMNIGSKMTYADVTLSALKKIHPGMKVIIVSESPSDMDARLVEMGVFYYLSGQVNHEIIQVVRAAARALESSRTKRKGVEGDR